MKIKHFGKAQGKSVMLLLRQAYPKLTARCFEGFGHGDIINHPELLVKELTQFMNK